MLIIKRIIELSTHINRTTHQTDTWVITIAGLIYQRLFNNNKDELIEESSLKQFNDVYQSLLSNLSSSNSLHQHDTHLNDSAMNFQPLEHKYLLSSYNTKHTSERSKQFLFELPNFIQRERKKAESLKVIPSTRSFALADQFNKPSMTNRASLSGMTSNQQSLSNRTSSGLRLSQGNGLVRKQVQVLDFSQVSQIKQGEKLLSSEDHNKKRHKSEPIVSIVSASVKVTNNEVNTETKTHANVKRDDIMASGRLSNETLKTATNTSIPNKSSSTHADSIANTNKTDVNEKTNKTRDSITTLTIPEGDLEIFFRSYPLLSDSDKDTIRKFFSPSGHALYPPSTPEMKFLLQKNHTVS